MKNIEKLLENEYREKLGTMKYENKSKLFSIYEKKERKSSKTRTVIIRRTAAALAFALIFVGGTSALAMTNPEVMSVFRNLIRASAPGVELSDRNVDDIEDRMENFHVRTQDVPLIMDSMEVNKYGETIGRAFTTFDLFKVGASGDPDDPTGYVYRYDLGVLENYMLLPEEVEYLESSGLMGALTAPDLNSQVKRNWVYVFDREGMNIIGKYIFPTGFKTNKQLEDPKVAAAFSPISEYNKYNEFVQDRIEYKRENGTAPEIGKVALDPLPTEGLNELANFDFEGLPPLSDDATVECDDPEFCSIIELITTGQGTDTPHAWARVICYKTGSAIFTIKEGDQEFQFKCTLFVDGRHYNVSWERIK